MSVLLDFLADQLGMLMLGATGLLVVGALAMWLQRSPIQRQRTGELTILAVLAWTLLACIPLPRWSLDGLRETVPETIAEPVAHEPIEIDAPLVSFAESTPLSAEEQAKAIERADILRQLAELDAELPADLAQPATLTAPAPVEPTPQVTDLHDDSLSTAHAVGGIPWRRWAAGVYLVAAVLSLGWLLLGRLLLRRLIRGADTPEAWLSQLYASLAPEVAPRLLVSGKCRRAFSCGWLQPTIMLPASCCTEHRGEQLRQILLHELAHVRQGDHRGRVIFNLALPLLSLHPLYWWIRGRTYLAAELLADDWAAQHSSCTTYAGELIALVKEQGRRGMAHVGTVGIFSSPTQFYRRMEMLVGRKTPLVTYCSRRWRLLTALAVILTVTTLSGVLGVKLVSADGDGETEVGHVASHEENEEPVAESGDEEAYDDMESFAEFQVGEDASDPGPADELVFYEIDEGQDDAEAADERSDFDVSTNAQPSDDVVAADEQPTPGDDFTDVASPAKRDSGRKWSGRSRGGLTQSERNQREKQRKRLRSRMADDRDDEGGSRRYSFSGGHVSNLPDRRERLLQMLKKRQREFLILRLRAMNRTASEKEKQISELLTSREMSDEQVIEAFYRTVMQRKPPEAELKIMREILALSEDRGESVQQLLTSLGKLDDDSIAAMLMFQIQSQIAKTTEVLSETAMQVKNYDKLSDEAKAKLFHSLNEKDGEFLLGIIQLQHALDRLAKMDEKRSQLVGANAVPKPVPVTFSPPTTPAPAEFVPFYDLSPQKGKAVSGARSSGRRTRGSRNAKPAAAENNRKGEKYVIVGFLDYDGDGKSDREEFDELISAAGAEVLGELQFNGRTIPESGDIHKLINKDVDVVVQGVLPDVSDAETPDEAKAFQRIQSLYKRVRFASEKHGVKIISPQIFVNYIRGWSLGEQFLPTGPESPKQAKVAKLRRPRPMIDGATTGIASSPATSIDAVSLAVDYSDALGKLPQAENELKRARKLHKNSAVTDMQLQKTVAKVEELKRRISILLTVAEVLRKSLTAELRVIDLEHETAKDEVQKARLSARLALVQGQLQILATIKPAKTLEEAVKHY